MNEKTQSDYKKLAAHFYKNKLNGEQPTPKRIADALKACASDYRPAYWRKLRNALAYDQQSKGYGDAAERINKTQNPATKDGSKLDVKPKQKRIKAISGEDEKRLIDALMANKDHESYAAVRVCKALGVRPAELKHLELLGDCVLIKGAKKSHGGSRGADRIVEVSNKSFNFIKAAIPVLNKADIGRVQDRIRGMGKRLWPKRSAVPTLYTWRHQMGSDLKASGLNRMSVAYIMGHQSTASVNVYGNKRLGNGGRSLPMPANEVLLNDGVAGIRENHTSKPPTAMQRAKESDAKVRAALQRQAKAESTLSM